METGGDHGAGDLNWLLDYELSSASRHRRTVSLIMVCVVGAGLTARMIKRLIRKSDELFMLGTEAAILMGETELLGALKAVERYKEAYLGELDVRFAVISYPADGEGLQHLLHVVQRRLDMARNAPSGAVISAG